jgi:crotonobetainyl-CoA:carnitine CoA-transferase CaiB-like acyl-CoA transferase
MTDKVLSGIKVLDLTHHIAGPYCTKLLADYGADVIKVERPGGGDDARRIGPFLGDDPHPEKSGLFLYLNTNKRGTTLNLKSEAGLNIFRRLVEDADILVENFSPGVMDRFGLGYEALEKINPRLVMTSISNFGQSGPYRDLKSSELIADAMGGWMTIIGDPEREPLKPGGSQAQFVGGLFGAVGTMTAFHGREVNGIGQQVDISLMEAVAYIQMNITSVYAYYQHIVKRIGNMVMPLPGTMLPCKDGYIGAFAITTSQWEILCDWMGKPEFKEDPSFITGPKRAENYDLLNAHLISWLVEHNQEELFREAQKRKLPFGIPFTSEMLLNSKHLKAREYFVEVDHPATGKVRYPGAQVKMGDTPYELQRAPLLGEHNEEIYCGRLGFGKAELADFHTTGVI